MSPSIPLIACFAPLAPVSGPSRLVAHQATDVFALWQAWEAECGVVCDVPYWAIVWPAARVLSQYIGEHPALVKGRSVLDCGCGCGVVAIAATVNGARHATGCDMDPVAIAMAERNAAANAAAIDLLCQDVVVCCDNPTFGLILVADLFYHKDFAQALMAALHTAHGRGCEILIADSGRPFLPKDDLAEIHAQTVATVFDVEGCRSRTVRLFKFR